MSQLALHIVARRTHDARVRRCLRHLTWLSPLPRSQRLATTFQLRRVLGAWRAYRRYRPHVNSFRRRLHRLDDPVFLFG